MSETPKKRKLEEIIDLNDGFCQTPPSAKKPRKRYTVQYKLEMIEASKNYSSQREFAAKHNFDESLIRLWRKSEPKLRESTKDTRFKVEGGGRKPLSYDLEFELSKWIMEQRNENLCVSRKLIQEKALDMANKKGLTDFKASMTWVQKFMDRNGFTIRRKTTQSQRLPPELSKKVSNFFFYLRKYYKQHPEITNAKIIAMDETSCLFENVSTTTVTTKGDKSVCMRTTGHEKLAVTVCLSAYANGNQVIFPDMGQFQSSHVRKY